MANNFKNAVIRNISTDSNLPTTIYTVPDTLKAIAIELDCSNKSSAGVTVTVQLEDESLNETKDQTGTVISANAHVISNVATGATGVLTVTSPALHNLIVNDRVIFSGTAPSFTDASLPASGDAAVSATRMYYVQSIPSTTTFTIAESKSASSPLTFDNAGSSVKFV